MLGYDGFDIHSPVCRMMGEEGNPQSGVVSRLMPKGSKLLEHYETMANELSHDMSIKILEAIGDIKASQSGMSSDVTYLRRRVDDLWVKVDEIERSKATRLDLQELEIRVEKSIAGMRAQTTVDLGRLDQDKIGHDQFSVDAFDNVSLRLEGIEQKLERLVTMETTVNEMRPKLDKLPGLEIIVADIVPKVGAHEQLRWYIVGAGAALLAAGSYIGWALHEAAQYLGKH